MKIASKDSRQRFKDVKSELDRAAAELATAIDDYNRDVEDLKNKVWGAYFRYTSKIEDLEEVRDEIVEEIDDYMGNKSSKWLKSEKSEEYWNWRNQLQELRFRPEDIDVPDHTIEFDEYMSTDELKKKMRLANSTSPVLTDDTPTYRECYNHAVKNLDSR